MDFTTPQFDYHPAYAPTIPRVDETDYPEDQWTCPVYDYDNRAPSALFVADHGFSNLPPYDFHDFHSYGVQYPGLSGGVPSVVEPQAVHTGFQDPTSIDLDTYPLLFDLTLTDADFNDLSSLFGHPTTVPHHHVAPDQESQQLPPVSVPSSSFPIGCGSLEDVSLVLQDNANQYHMFPICAGGPEDTTPRNIDYACPRQIWSYLDVRDDGRCACTWKKGPGEVCGFKSSIDLVKRHVRRVHYGLKHHTCTECNQKFFTRHTLKLHLNVHTGARPYKCYYCKLRYASPSARLYHEKRYHTRAHLPELGTKYRGW